jgi:DNA-binding NarL/FixJ family response regulator
LLEACGIEVVGTATTGPEAVALVDSCRPHVVLLDVYLPEGGGLAVCRALTEAFPHTKVLLLSYVDEDVHLADSWAANAAGFVLKSATEQQLVLAIRLASEGRGLYTPEQLRRIRNWQRTVHRYLEELSDRERGVLTLIINGMSNRGIAKALVLSENTVEKHVSSVLGKFEVHSRAQLISFCFHRRIDLSAELGAGGVESPPEEEEVGLVVGAGR